MATGIAIEVPALSFTVWVLAQLGVGNPDVPGMKILRLTTLFVGMAALFTAGGIGRLTAYASMDGGRRRAVIVGARAHAAASAGLVIIAAIPHGQLPGHSLAWLALPLGGMVSGAACGALIGFVCGGSAGVELSEVLHLARRPSEALRHWFDAKELVRLRSAVRHRTTHLFEGMFEPAQLPPTEAAKPAPVAATIEPAPVAKAEPAPVIKAEPPPEPPAAKAPP
ncbi:MAG TPA: hypothetical protein VGC42_14310 [Kofleriaceae bacterium]